jgi:anti-sigma factor RsiW
MTDCDAQLLSAYVDGEVDADARRRVERHLQECQRCADEVRGLRETSQLLKTYPFADIDREELTRAHEAIDSAVDQPVWRLGFTLGVIAASVLIVSCAWLMELPKATQPAPTSGTQLATTPQWERMAMTLKADPLRPAGEQTAELNDSRLAEWMLNGLGGKNTHEEDAN